MINRVLLSFKKKKKWYQFLSKKEVTLNFITATTNIAIFGGTGTGKTTSICQPLLNNLINNKCSGLILDVKGDYSNLARHFNRRNEKPFLILGVKQDCEKFNIISGISPEKLKVFIKDALSEYSFGNNSSYWGMNGIEDVILIYELLKGINEEVNPTLADLYFYLINKEQLKNIVFQIKELRPEFKEKINARLFTDKFSVFNFEITTETSDEQRTWQLSKLLKVLKPFYENNIIRHHFCNNENIINYWEEIYKNKKSFIIEFPMTKFPEPGIFCLKILKSIFIDTIKEQPITLPKQNSYGTKYFTFMLIDEYQQFLNPSSEVSMDDNNWFDISRGYGHINIISTQSVDSLIEKSNLNYVNQLIGNTRNIIHLPTNAICSLENIKILGGSDVANMLLYPKKDIAFLYIGKDQISRKGYSSVIFTARSKLNIMNHYVKNKISFIKVNDTIEIDTEQYSNRHYQLLPSPLDIKDDKIVIKLDNIPNYINTGKNIWNPTLKPKITINKSVSIITSQANSEGFKDFNLIINKLGIDFKKLKVYSVIHKNKLHMKFYNSRDSQSIFKKDSLILYIRGGGNMEDCFLNTEEHLEKIKEKIINKDITIGIGYGHADNKFNLVEDNIATIWGITPTELAYKLFEYYKEN